MEEIMKTMTGIEISECIPSCVQTTLLVFLPVYTICFGISFLYRGLNVDLLCTWVKYVILYVLIFMDLGVDGTYGGSNLLMHVKCKWLQMVEYFNRRANLFGHSPLGSFNAAFSYTGSKHIDAATTKTLSIDGFFIPLAKLELRKSSMVLQQNARRAIPTLWDPPALAR